MKNHPLNWIFTIILVLTAGVWLYTNYGLIHTKEISEAVISEKTHNDEGYFIKVNGKELQVKDENTWMLLNKGEAYHVTYEWYGTKTPFVTHVNQPHDKDQIGGH
ncbi:hypothetical protein MUN89_05060 [Halobacillus salinarum]|uniref:DUF3139 domain-containing protein n=1 Tax=Halobacillus salinarum TaxID=2932257 RepID=A0ABY4EMU6_9BACI|nr:hypothetical protein [Halobacillus salinarum]UOQ45320.1 hypothetical protein MUN89_05060 [Halobacillus salinarum]